MLRITRHPFRAGGLVAILVAALGAMFLISGSAQAKSDFTHLTPTQRLNIATSGHPHLMRVCDVGLSVGSSGIVTRTKDKKQAKVIVGQTTCLGATAGSPTDTGVYDRRGHELYIIDTGKTFHKGKRWVTPISIRKVAKGKVAVVYAGYLPKDPMCCASRMYERVFTLHTWNATHGKLHRVPVTH